MPTNRRTPDPGLPTEQGVFNGRLRNAENHLVAARRRAARRLRHHGRARHGRRHAAALRRAQRHRTARHHQHRRSALGRQPGVVHHRRRRHLRRLAARLCNRVLGLLLGDARRALGALLPAGRLRLPQQDPRRALAFDVGLGPVRRRRRAAADLRRRLRQPAAGRALPLRRIPRLVLHRLVLGIAQPVRARLRRRLHGDDHLPRRQLPRAPDRRRHPAARDHCFDALRSPVHREFFGRRRLAVLRHRRLRHHLRR